MKTLASTLLFSIALLLTSCDNCSDIDCTTPPAPFQFELVDATTGENLLSTEQISGSGLSLSDLNAQRSIRFEITDENGRMIITTNDIGWQTELLDIAFSLGGVTLFNFKVNAENVTEDCCNFTRYSDISVDGAESRVENSTGIYIISLQL
jgi:hypothetical protein